MGLDLHSTELGLDFHSTELGLDLHSTELGLDLHSTDYRVGFDIVFGRFSLVHDFLYRKINVKQCKHLD